MKIDPFRSRFDNVDSIGFSLDLPKVDVSKALENLSAGLGPKDVEKIGAKLIGKVGDLQSLVDSGSKVALAQLANVKDSLKSELSKLASDFDPAKLAKGDIGAATKTISAGAQALTGLIRGGKERDPSLVRQLGELGKVTDDPTLLAAVGAMTFIPVIGPILSGVTGAMLVLAGPLLELGDALGDAIFFSGESEAQRARRKANNAFIAANSPLRTLQGPAYLSLDEYKDRLSRLKKAYSGKDTNAIVSILGGSAGGGMVSIDHLLRTAKDLIPKLEKFIGNYQTFLEAFDGKAVAKKLYQAQDAMVRSLAPILGAAEAGDAKSKKVISEAKESFEKAVAETKKAAAKTPAGVFKASAEAASKGWWKWGDIMAFARGGYDSKGKALDKSHTKKYAKERQLYLAGYSLVANAAAKKGLKLLEKVKTIKPLLVTLSGRIMTGDWKQGSSGTEGVLVDADGSTKFGKFGLSSLSKPKK